MLASEDPETFKMEPDLVFQNALDTFKKNLTARQCRDFSITTLQDVKDEVNRIQSQHGSAKKLRGMSRMSKFLEAMRQLEQVISVFLNVSEAVAFIWVSTSMTTCACPKRLHEGEPLISFLSKGPIKFFLVVSKTMPHCSLVHIEWLNQLALSF